MTMLKHFKRHKEFIGHVGAIMSGRSIAAAFGLLLTPVVARLFAPADFGVAASYLAIAAIAAQVASLRYESAVVLPKDDQEALLLVALAFRILPVFCLLMLVVTALLMVSGTSWRAFNLLGGWVWVLPITVLVMGGQDIQESWLSRKKLFGFVSKTVALESALGGVARIGFGVLGGSSVYGLILGHLLGATARLVMQGRAGVDSLKATFGRIEWPRMRVIARRYSDFPKLNAPAGLVFSTGQNLPVLMFGALFSPEIAGFFAMANRLAQIPVQIVAASVRRVFLQKAAAIHNDGRSLRRSYVLTALGLFAIGVIPCAAIWMYGQVLLGWLLGERWLRAGHFLEIIAPWMLLTWVTAPCNSIFIVLRKQHHWLVQQSVVTVVRLCAFGIGYALALGAERTLELFVVFAIVGNVVTILSAFVLTAQVGKPSDPTEEHAGRQERFPE